MPDLAALSADWESLGAEASPKLDRANALVVVGADPVVAARAAIGIGRAQARVRRVAIGDLVGEVEPLQRLVAGDDPHGIVDSFLYGVSLNRIARQADDSGMLFIMPSGTEPVVTRDILTSDRWARLATGFREVGALLLLVVAADAPGARDLIDLLGGAVVVGDPGPLAIPTNLVAAFIQPPIAAATAAAAAAAIDPALGSARRPSPARPQSPVLLPSVADEPEPEPPTSGGPWKQRLPWLVGGGLAAVAGLWFLLGRPGSGGEAPPDLRAEVEAPAPASNARVGIPAPPPDSAALAASRRATDSLGALVPANLADSARAAAYSVVLVSTNEESTALARWVDLAGNLPANTVTTVRVRGQRGRTFLVQAGAFTRARSADSLLAALRSSGKLQATEGRMVAAPYALELESKVGRRQAEAVAEGYVQRQIAAYPLLQPDNSASIFVGAFETPEQAAALMAELKQKGFSATLKYRTGRSF